QRLVSAHVDVVGSGYRSAVMNGIVLDDHVGSVNALNTVVVAVARPVINFVIFDEVVSAVVVPQQDSTLARVVNPATANDTVRRNGVVVERDPVLATVVNNHVLDDQICTSRGADTRMRRIPDLQACNRNITSVVYLKDCVRIP